MRYVAGIEEVHYGCGKQWEVLAVSVAGRRRCSVVGVADRGLDYCEFSRGWSEVCSRKKKSEL